MGVCLYCQENRKLTEEHVVSDWISKIVPAAFPKSSHIRDRWVLDQRTGSYRKYSFEGGTAGDPISRKLKIVCSDCNNGWMSRIVEAAKPAAKTLIEGRWPHMAPVTCRQLATWAALSAMTWERADLELAATTPAEHEWMWKHHSPPPGWRVWFGVAEHPLETIYTHRGCALAPANGEVPEGCNAQSTVLTVGKLAFQVANSQLDRDLRRFDYASTDFLTRIWPRPPAGVRRPGRPFTNDARAVALEFALVAFTII